LLPPLLFYCLGMGCVHVPKLNVILALICHKHHFESQERTTNRARLDFDDPSCQAAEVHALPYQFIFYANLILGLLPAVTSPKIRGTVRSPWQKKGAGIHGTWHSFR
jgi:hypothetical protein